MKLSLFLKAEFEDIVTDLTATVENLKSFVRINPEEFTEAGSDEPSIDVRLCVDEYDGLNRSFTWIIRTGDASFDQKHSPYCAASLIGLDTEPRALAQELIDDIAEQEHKLCIMHKWATS